MRINLFALVLGLALTTAAWASELPDYYAENDIRRAGTIDAVYFDQSSIVINDAKFSMSDNVIVHGLSAYSVPKSQLKPGVLVAYKVGAGRMITKFWLLPDDYDIRARR